VRAGDTVVVYGAGGVDSTAVPGARHAGAKNVVVVDPVEFKRDMSEVVGAAHTLAHDVVVETTWGQLTGHARITVGVLSDEVIAPELQMVGRAAR
jgi:Zn-dependent alcohol dehydrogenase